MLSFVRVCRRSLLFPLKLSFHATYDRAICKLGIMRMCYSFSFLQSGMALFFCRLWHWLSHNKKCQWGISSLSGIWNFFLPVFLHFVPLLHRVDTWLPNTVHILNKKDKFRNYVLLPLLVPCTKVHSHITFFVKTFLLLFHFEISIKFCVFFTHIKNIWKKIFWGHISTFCKLLSRTRKKRLKKSKNVFYKCGLELALYPISIHGSGL
jgi:hypothetical protein